MYAYVDESHPHQTHFGIPFTMIVISLCVCVPFWKATLNLFGQLETVWDILVFTDHQTTYFSFKFYRLVSVHLFASG